MFQSIGAELGVVVDDDASGDPFSDPGILDQYAVIIFSNTSGNAILNAQQRINFEAWVANGGQVLGIHAASDTYRHSTANGNNTGTWDFYAELMGASVQEDPNHVNGTPTYSMQRIGAHPSIYGLPDIWAKAEEYYYWEGGYFDPNNTAVLIVEQTVGPNGLVNSYDAARPMSWYRTPAVGSREFYTALGHAQENYTSDALFRVHLRDALEWLLEVSTGTATVTADRSAIFPNPADDLLHIRLPSGHQGLSVTLRDAMGRVVLQQQSSSHWSMDTQHLANGSYTMTIGDQLPTQVIILH
jgi:type 1 glutamine amidotransferase